MGNQVQIRAVASAADYSVAKGLILEYVQWLGFDLAFQNFDKEMETIQETYGEPHGGLFLAIRNDKAVGIAGIKRFNETDCEVKRMFVQSDSRGLGLGNLLLTACIELAKKLNYHSIKLDTADYMKQAIKLYSDKGFVEIPAYRHNPHEHAKYFQLIINF